MTGEAPTPLDGIRYYTPPDGYILTGRDGLVHIQWKRNLPVPLVDADFSVLAGNGNGKMPDYDTVGRGIYQALRRNPACAFAQYYAEILKEAYPHIVSELGGQIIMLEAKDVDTPYLDRKITDLKIMALIDPGNAGVQREIARTYVEKGSRLATLYQAVSSWYAAEKSFLACLALDPDDHVAGYEYGEVLYVLGRYNQAATVWEALLPKFSLSEQSRLKSRLETITTGKLPLVPPLDYLTAIAIAVEEHQSGNHDGMIAILEDVLADTVFCEHFPVKELWYMLGSCYQEQGMMDNAAEAFKRS